MDSITHTETLATEPSAILDCGANWDAVSKVLVEQAVRTSRLRLAPEYIIKLRGLTDRALQQHETAAALLADVRSVTKNVTYVKVTTTHPEEPLPDVIYIEDSTLITQSPATLKARFSEVHREWAALSNETEHIYNTMGDACGELMVALVESESAYYDLEKQMSKLEKEMGRLLDREWR